MPHHITPRDHQHWLELRHEDVTSTDVSALFGLSTYLTEYELYYQKTHPVVDKDLDTVERIKWGKRMEPEIAKGMAVDLNMSIVAAKDYYRHSDEPHMGTSLDYIITDHDIEGVSGKGIMEVKGLDYLIHRDNWTETEATTYIETQVQHQMEVMDIDWCLITALVGGNDPKVLYRKRDREVGTALRLKVRQFWADVKAGNEPEPDFERDSEFIIKLHQSAGGEVYDASNDDIVSMLMADYEILTEKVTRTERMRKETKARMFELIGDDVGKVIDGAGLTLHCSMSKGTKPTVITKEMIGCEYGGRRSSRGFRVVRKTTT